jgi:hypothetical protein
VVTEHCQTWEALAAVGELAADDPRRIHVAGCPRCRARLSAYRAFMAGDLPAAEHGPASDLTAARTHLDTALAREIYAADDRPAGRANDAGRRGRFVATVWRPALALAAILVVMVGLRANDVSLELPPTMPGTEPIMRGAVEPDESALAVSIVPGTAADTWTLTWRTPEPADGSSVVLYDSGLAEVTRFDAGAAETFLLRKDAVSAPEKVAFLRIVFDANGDEIDGGQPRSFSF